ncbi:hypothetical protein NC652_028042 [Populus alba x Populus x berolinensis]|nr:hypothetical protein NC652_028042 [Populus alba x Populus x berolinensis]
MTQMAAMLAFQFPKEQISWPLKDVTGVPCDVSPSLLNHNWMLEKELQLD